MTTAPPATTIPPAAKTLAGRNVATADGRGAGMTTMGVGTGGDRAMRPRLMAAPGRARQKPGQASCDRRGPTTTVHAPAPGRARMVRRPRIRRLA